MTVLCYVFFWEINNSTVIRPINIDYMTSPTNLNITIYTRNINKIPWSTTIIFMKQSVVRKTIIISSTDKKVLEILPDFCKFMQRL